MERKEFEKICSAVQAGEERFLEHAQSQDTGKILACSTDRFEVDIAGKRESWPMALCEETMGSKYGHKERTLDTHPWDTDRFNPYT